MARQSSIGAAGRHRVSELLHAGIAGAVLSLAALATASALRGDWPLAALNATAHWAFGAEAARLKAVEPGVTGLGLLTHVLAALFWAVPYVAGASFLRIRSTFPLFALGLAVALLAAVVDYGLLPRWMSPGWHLVLGPPGVAAGFAAMGAGLFLGKWLADSR